MGSASRVVQPSTLVALLTTSTRTRLLVVGDVLLDDYVAGPSDRLSPEAPVPVVRVDHRWCAPGGAAHVAHVAARLGASVDLVGVVGDDEHGARLRGLCDESGIGTDGVVTVDGRPTTRKVRVMSGSQQIVRLDHEATDVPADTSVEDLVAALGVAPAADVIVVSDYAKGVLGERILAEVMALGARWGAPVVVDPKHPDLQRYRGASVIKLNRQEFAAAVGAAHDAPLDLLLGAAADAHERSGAPLILVTLGHDGLVLLEQGAQPVHLSAASHDVFDVTGAGDVVAAVLALGLAAELPPIDAAALANVAAGLSVQRVGVRAIDAAELAGAVLASTAPSVVRARDELAAMVRAWQLAGERVVFTNGCFDLFHPGHLELLRRSAALGDRLVVAVDTDASVTRLKGVGRPVLDETARTNVIAAIDVVDAVVTFDDDLLELVDLVGPDVLVKGADYQGREVVGRDLVEARGGRVELIPLLVGHSTSSIVERLGAAVPDPSDGPHGGWSG